MPAKKTATVKQTKHFFKNVLEIEITEEEARVATERLVELFQLLDKWNKDYWLPPCAAFWFVDRRIDINCN